MQRCDEQKPCGRRHFGVGDRADRGVVAIPEPDGELVVVGLQAEPGVAVARIALANLDRGGDQQAFDFCHGRDQFGALPVVERLQDRRRGVVGALVQRREFAAPRRR